MRINKKNLFAILASGLINLVDNDSLAEEIDTSYIDGIEVAVLNQRSTFDYFVRDGNFEKNQGSSSEVDNNDVIEVYDKGYKKAKTLLDKLYDPDSNIQREFVKGAEEENSGHQFITHYNRGWAYTQGITLSYLTRNNDKRAHKIAERTYDTAIPVVFDGEEFFGGWKFSENVLGDNWSDSRLITGSNARRLLGFGEYIVSPLFDEIPEEKQEEFEKFYSRALDGLLKSQREIKTEDGLEYGLVNAGWSIEEISLENMDELNSTLSDYGYRNGRIKKLEHAVTEHSGATLSLLNFSIENSDRLGLNKENLIKRRDGIKDSLFEKLYYEKEGCFSTGTKMDSSGNEVQSEHRAVDSIWFPLEGFTSDQMDKIARALDYNIKKFVKDIDYHEKHYHGAHYFLNSMCDPPLPRSDLFESAYNLEAGWILAQGLNEFSDVYPTHPSSDYFRETAQKLRKGMQDFIEYNGFLCSSQDIPEWFAKRDSSTSALSYLNVADYYKKKSKLELAGFSSDKDEGIAPLDNEGRKGL